MSNLTELELTITKMQNDIHILRVLYFIGLGLFAISYWFNIMNLANINSLKDKMYFVNTDIPKINAKITETEHKVRDIEASIVIAEPALKNC